MSVYSADDSIANHVRRSAPNAHPLLHAFLAMDMDDSGRRPLGSRRNATILSVLKRDLADASYGPGGMGKSAPPSNHCMDLSSIGVVQGVTTLHQGSARRADADAFEALAAAHYPRLLRRLMLVVRDAEEAKDLAQATFERAFGARAGLDGRDPGPWLNTIGLRLALNEVRRRKRRPWLRLQREVSGGDGMPDPDLWAALGELRREERVAIVLNVLEGYTQSEIAQQLEVPEGTVASWVSRGKTRLRARLEERA